MRPQGREGDFIPAQPPQQVHRKGDQAPRQTCPPTALKCYLGPSQPVHGAGDSTRDPWWSTSPSQRRHSGAGARAWSGAQSSEQFRPPWAFLPGRPRHQVQAVEARLMLMGPDHEAGLGMGLAGPDPPPPGCLGPRHWGHLDAGQAESPHSAAVALEHMPGDHQPLDLAGALIDLRDAGISVVPLGWHLGHVAHAPQDLDGLGGRLEGSGAALGARPAGRQGRAQPAGPTWWLTAVAASDAANLAIAAS